jgi:PAS domain S-box-containing protein
LADNFSFDDDTLTAEQRAEVFEAAPEPVKVLNADGEVLRANQAAQRALGASNSALAGRSVLDFVSPDHHDALRAAIAGAVAGRACVLEISLRRDDGAEIWWKAHLYPLDRTQRGPIVMSCRDISAIRRRDADLSGQAKILRAIAEGEPLSGILDQCCRLADQAVDGGRCCILLHDDQGVAVAGPPANGAPLALPSVLLASLHDVPIAEGPDAADTGTARFRVVVAPYDPLASPQAGQRADQPLQGLSTCWSLPLRAGGRVVGAFAAYIQAAKPPTDAALAQIWNYANLASLALGQLAARRALAESESRFRVAAEVVPGFLWVADPSGNLTYVNRVYRERTGHTAEELIAGAWLDTIHPHDRDDCASLWKTAMAAGVGVEGRYRIRMADGTYRWYLDRGMPQHGADGSITAWVGVAVDIEELIASREAIQRYRAELEEQISARTEALSVTASELHAETSRREQAMEALAHKHKIDALGQLTAGVAHDFNNVLSAIMGSFQLIEGRPHDAAVQQLIQNGLHASERGASLVRQLLSVARREPPRPETIDLAEALPTMRALLRHALNPRHVLSVEVADGVWPVFVDAPQLEIALLNLAVNARDAMGETGILTIGAANAPAGALPGEAAGFETARRETDYVAITVTDTGSGIPPQLLERVCDPFFTTKPRGEGTGLGLAMVKGFVTDAGGAIALESTPGVGTRITLRLPRAEMAAQPPDEPSVEAPRAMAPAHAHPRRETTALVVEDDDEVRPVTCAFLREAGYRVFEAASGPVALALLQVSGNVDVLVTDLAMPSMDGLQLVQAVHAARPGLPVVLVTSHADSHDLSAEIVVRKPFTSNDLTQAVERALSRVAEPPKRTDRLLSLMRSDITREAYLTWQALRGAVALPRFDALTVAGQAWADHAFMLAVDPEYDPPHFRWVSVGRALAAYLPHMAGETVSASSRSEALLGPLEQIYLGCTADFMPHFQAVEADLGDGRSAPGERLLMPVTSGGAGVTHLLGIITLEPS